MLWNFTLKRSDRLFAGYTTDPRFVLTLFPIDHRQTLIPQSVASSDVSTLNTSFGCLLFIRPSNLRKEQLLMDCEAVVKQCASL
jgi:hypothetical protein